MLKLMGLASAVVSLLLACPFAAAQSVLRVCNKGDLDLAVMTLVNYHNPVQVMVGVDGWVEDGWTMVKMQACESVYEPPMDQPAYIGFLYRTSDGDIRTPVISGSNESWIQKVTTFKLCVSLTPFNVTDRDVKKLQQCSGGRTISLPVSIYFQPSGTNKYDYTVSPLQSNSVSLTRSQLAPHVSSNPAPKLDTKQATNLVINPRVIMSHSMGKADEPPMSSLPKLHSTPPISNYVGSVIVDWLYAKSFLADADANFEGIKFNSQPIDVQGTTWYKTNLHFPGWSDACLLGTPRDQPKEFFCSTQFLDLNEASRAYQELSAALTESSLRLRPGHFDSAIQSINSERYKGFYTAYTPYSAYVELAVQMNGDGKYDMTFIAQAPERTVRTSTAHTHSPQLK